MHLLLAESDTALAAFLQRSFGIEHSAVQVTERGSEAESIDRGAESDLRSLDLKVGHPEGLEVRQHIPGVL